MKRKSKFILAGLLFIIISMILIILINNRNKKSEIGNTEIQKYKYTCGSC